MRQRPEPPFLPRLLTLLLLAAVTLLAHVGFLLVLATVLPRWFSLLPAPDLTPMAVSVLDGPLLLDPLAPPPELQEPLSEAMETEPEPPPEEPQEFKVLLPSGQIVDVAPPAEPKVPEHADYLAEHDNAVLEETRSERFKMNPEVLASRYSEESKLAFEDVEDLGVTEPSTGARAGNPSPDMGRAGPFSPIQSPFAITNKEGLQKPVPASHKFQDFAGAPSNDLLDEKAGAGVNLNTREFLFANYINRVRRLVNYYWQQNLDNLPSSTRLTRSRYETVVDVTLTAQGGVERVEVSRASGLTPLDNAVVMAFRMAGPFPNPPVQLVDSDGRARLPDFGFVVQVGQARAQYHGIDPRADVQFPGILKSPR